LNKDDYVKFAAWRREHPTKKPVLKVKVKKGRTPSTAIKMAADEIEKDLDRFLKDFKKSSK
jgi:DNA-directed RNA polymerase subunit L